MKHLSIDLNDDEIEVLRAALTVDRTRYGRPDIELLLRINDCINAWSEEQIHYKTHKRICIHCLGAGRLEYEPGGGHPSANEECGNCKGTGAA